MLQELSSPRNAHLIEIERPTFTGVSEVFIIDGRQCQLRVELLQELERFPDGDGKRAFDAVTMSAQSAGKQLPKYAR
jgi:hypothetical protein